jgi:hypothetical protein
MRITFTLMIASVLLAGCAAKPQDRPPAAAGSAEAERRAFVASYRNSPEGQEALRRSAQMCQAGDNDGCSTMFTLLGQSPEVAFDAFHTSGAQRAVVGPALCFSTSVGNGDLITRCD